MPAEGYDDVAVALAVNRTNLRLSVTERIRKHALVPPFTIDNGLLTPSQKIRRVPGDARQFTDTGHAASRTVRHCVTSTSGIVWEIA